MRLISTIVRVAYTAPLHPNVCRTLALLASMEQLCNDDSGRTVTSWRLRRPTVTQRLYVSRMDVNALEVFSHVEMRACDDAQEPMAWTTIHTHCAPDKKRALLLCVLVDKTVAQYFVTIQYCKIRPCAIVGAANDLRTRNVAGSKWVSLLL